MQCRRSLAMEHQKVKFFLTGAMCSCAVAHCAAKCNSVKDALHWSWVHQCNAELSAPVQCSAFLADWAPSASYRTQCTPPPPSAIAQVQCITILCNVLQCFATFCNILQRFATYRNAEDSMQPRSSSANVQKAGYSSLSWSNTKYKDINIKFKTKQGRCETPISWDMDFAIQSFFIQIWWEAEWHILKLPKTFVAWKG